MSMDKTEIARLKKWMEYIDARIDERIAQAFRRESITEGNRVDEIRRELEALLGLERYTL